jgi:hypothetical protein
MLKFLIPRRYSYKDQGSNVQVEEIQQSGGIRGQKDILSEERNNIRRREE